MTSQSSFNIATGATITEAYLDGITQHLPTIETAAPSTVFEGKLYVRSDTDTLEIHDGSTARSIAKYGAASTTAPVCYQNGTVLAAASSTAKYIRLGRLMHWSFRWDAATLSGPGATGVIELDIGIATYGVPRVTTYETTGSFILTDASTGIQRCGSCVVNGSGRVEFYTDGGTGALGTSGNAFSVTNSDVIFGSIFYEATS